MRLCAGFATPKKKQGLNQSPDVGVCAHGDACPTPAGFGAQMGRTAELNTSHELCAMGGWA